jgi:hypothetical protein
MKWLGSALIVCALIVGSMLGDLGLMSEVDGAAWDRLSAYGIGAWIGALLFVRERAPKP